LKNPQVDFEATMFLNMGQILSIPLIIAGAVLWYLAKRRKKIAD
jgi:prolipoprotein diacylglyceryltransferase